MSAHGGGAGAPALPSRSQVWNNEASQAHWLSAAETTCAPMCAPAHKGTCRTFSSLVMAVR